MKQQIAASFAALLLAVSLTSCGSLSHIEDTNGEDPALCSLEQQLTDKTPDCLCNMFFESNTNGNYTAHTGKLSGVRELCSFRVDEGETLCLQVTSTLESGNLRIYLYRDGEIVADLPLGEEQIVELAELEAGAYFVRVAGESAKFELELKKMNS